MDREDVLQLIESHKALLSRLEGLQARASARALLMDALLELATSPADMVQAFLQMIEVSAANKTDLQHARRWFAAVGMQYNQAARSKQ